MAADNDNAEALTAVRSRGFIKIRAQSYETESGHRNVRVTKRTRMHKFESGYEDTGRESVVFDGKERDARLLLDVLDEVVTER